jgi:hypothetical protein
VALVVELVSIACAAVAVAVSLRWLPPRSTMRRARQPPSPQAVPDELVRLPRMLSSAGVSPVHLHAYLRPLLVEIASRQLAVRGRALDRMSDRAGRELLGEALWEIVRPNRRFPADRYGPGLAPREVAALLDVLERL